MGMEARKTKNRWAWKWNNEKKIKKEKNKERVGNSYEWETEKQRLEWASGLKMVIIWRWLETKHNHICIHIYTAR